MEHYQCIDTSEEHFIKENTFDLNFEAKSESLFASCNGYMGVRAVQPFPVYGEKRESFVEGLFHKANDNEVTELVNIPDSTEFAVYVDGKILMPNEDNVREFSRSLDLSSGELVIRYQIHTLEGKEYVICNRRFASITNPHLLVQAFSVQGTETDCSSITVETGLNAQMTNQGVSHFNSLKILVHDRHILDLTAGFPEDSIHMQCTCNPDRKPKRTDFVLDRRKIREVFQFDPLCGEKITLTKICYIVKESEDISDEERYSELRRAEEIQYGDLLEDQKEKMSELLQKQSLYVEGLTVEQETSIRFAQYHLVGMLPGVASLAGSVAAKGFTGEGYKGHVFWDTEVFILPVVILFDQNTAKKLLMYRAKGLQSALDKAAERGYQGAMYPWESAATGEEETPEFAALNIHTGKANRVASAEVEIHVTADIAYSIDLYYQLTNDDSFMVDHGFELIFRTADFWTSYAVPDAEKGFVINRVSGPDEYTEYVNNNAYTNYMACFNVKKALEYADLLKKKNPDQYVSFSEKYDIDRRKKEWEKFINTIYLPRENVSGIIPQNDGFLSYKDLPEKDIEQYKNSEFKQAILKDYSRDQIEKMQLLKQADLVMLFNLFPKLFPADVVKKNVLYYEKRTLHDSSLSYCAHVQACAGIGEYGTAWKFFQKCLEVDLNDNWRDSDDGIHAAAQVGILNCLMYGFAGISVEEGILRINPHLPEKLHKLGFNFIFHGRNIRIFICHDRMELTLNFEGEEPVQIRVGRRIYELTQEKTVIFVDGNC
jgi:hypothetical glycosyl hydrolase